MTLCWRLRRARSCTQRRSAPGAAGCPHSHPPAPTPRDDAQSGDKLTTLDEYISRMKDGQKSIYYLAGTSKDEVANSPFLEQLLKKDYEVGRAGGAVQYNQQPVVLQGCTAGAGGRAGEGAPLVLLARQGACFCTYTPVVCVAAPGGGLRKREEGRAAQPRAASAHEEARAAAEAPSAPSASPSAEALASAEGLAEWLMVLLLSATRTHACAGVGPWRVFAPLHVPLASSPVVAVYTRCMPRRCVVPAYANAPPVLQVIFYTDVLDEYVMGHLLDYDDKKFANASKEVGRRPAGGICPLTCPHYC